MNKTYLTAAGLVTKKVIIEGAKAVAIATAVNYGLTRLLKGKDKAHSKTVKEWMDMI